MKKTHNLALFHTTNMRSQSSQPRFFSYSLHHAAQWFRPKFPSLIHPESSLQWVFQVESSAAALRGGRV